MFKVTMSIPLLCCVVLCCAVLCCVLLFCCVCVYVCQVYCDCFCHLVTATEGIEYYSDPVCNISVLSPYTTILFLMLLSLFIILILL